MTAADLIEFPSLSADAPAAFAKAIAVRDCRAFQRAFCDWSAKPKKRFEKIFGDLPLVSAICCEAGDGISDCVRALLNADRKSPRKQALANLIERLSTTFETEPANRIRSTIVLLEVLLRYSDAFDAEVLTQVIVRLCQLNVLELKAELESDEETGFDLVAADLLMPFLFDLLLAPFERATENTDTRTRFTGLVNELSDTDGVPDAHVVQNLDGWVGLFAITTGWAKSFRTEWIKPKAATRWQDMSACLAGYLSAKPFSEAVPYTGAHLALVTEKTLELAGHSAKTAVRKYTATLAANESETKSDGKVSGSHQSDWAANALMRSGMQASSDALAFQWHAPSHNVSLIADGCEVIRGFWQTQVTVNGKTQPAADDWECTCWFEDDEVAFVELEVAVATGVKQIRQVVLSLQDQFAILLDSVICDPDGGNIEVTSFLPHASWLTASSDSITRDWKLRHDELSVRTVPLWLPDDRLNSGAGDFSIEEGRLKMVATGQGGVTMPLFFDWGHKRDIHDADWNKLTITEERQVVSAREAAAFRVRIGKLQLMLYRSFCAADDLRAVLGQHTAKETLIGHVRDSGDVDPLVMVEGEDE